MSRIVAGTARGRRLATPPGAGTRPTTDRVREALFSRLESLLGGLDGCAVLDLYAGSGALGLEAASRGAARVTLVEQDRRVAALARQNAAAVAVAGVDVRALSVERFLRDTAPHRYDVVLLDPPYAVPTGDVEVVLGGLTAGWLTPDAVVVVERSTRTTAPSWPPGMTALRERAYGETTLYLAETTEEHRAEE